MKNLLFVIILHVRFISANHNDCIDDGVTDFQLTSSGYYVQSKVSCISVCNSYFPGVFSYAFFLDNQICFCRNSSQLDIPSITNCTLPDCQLETNSYCILKNYWYTQLSLGIIDWEITFNPTIALVDDEVEIKTNILQGGALTAFVTPIPNGLPLDVQTVDRTTVKTHFYLPGLQLWSQKIGNDYADPFNTFIWLQINERVGGVYVIPSTINVNGFYNFFMVVTQGTKVTINILLPMNKNVNFTADVICLSYGLDLPMFYGASTESCSLKDGFVLNQVILSSGYLKKIKLKVYDTGTFKIVILRPTSNFPTNFCAFGLDCTNLLDSSTVSALVVKSFLFSLTVKGIIEIPIQKIDVEENDMIWIGGNASLHCNATSYIPMSEMYLGNIVTFSINKTYVNRVFISFFISKPIEYYIPVPSSTIGLFNINIDVYDYVSSIRRFNYSFPIQVPISGLRFDINKPYPRNFAGYKLNSYLSLKAAVDSGTDVLYLFDIPLLNYSQISSGDSVDVKMTTLGVFTVYLTAGNRLNSVNTSIEISVLSEIKSLQLKAEQNQLQDSNYSTTVSILNGTSVRLLLDFGDGSPVVNKTDIDATGVNGFIYNVSHKYSVCNIYTITATVSNTLVNSRGASDTLLTSSTIITVFCILSPLNVIATPTVSQNRYAELSPTKSLIVNINHNGGSYPNYSIDWGDGIFSYNNQSVMNLKFYSPVIFQVEHMYKQEGTFDVSVTCKNALQKLSFIFQVQVKSCSVPYVSFYYGTASNPITVFRNLGKEFTGFVEKGNPSCESKTSAFEWNLTSNNFFKLQKGILANQKVVYKIEKKALEVGLYTLSLQYVYGDISTVYTAYVNVTLSPLIMDIENGYFNSIAYKIKLKNQNESSYQNFTISAENSNDPEDPTVGIQGITFLWRCKVASNFSDAQTVMANSSSLNFTYRGDTCYNQTWVRLQSKSSYISFSTYQFLEGINYHFEVCGSKYAGKDMNSKDQYKTGCFIQQFSILAGSVPTIFLKCISNCDTKLNFQERVIYSFVCGDCGSNRIEGKWIVKDDESNDLPENATTTGFSTPSLVIKRDTLRVTKNYTFALVVSYAGSLNSAKFEFTKTACSKPEGGVCYVNPTSGYALSTKFSIICYNWKDFDDLLFYRFYYDNGQIERMDLSSTSSVDYPLLNAKTIDQPSLVNFVMGPGDQNNDYKIVIYSRVSNKYNAYAEQILTIKVKPNDKDLVVTDINNMLTDIDMSDTQSVANIVQAISSTLNKASSTSNLSSSSPNEVRTQVIGLINKISVVDLQSFKSVSDGLVSSSKYPGEIAFDAQNKAANVVKRLSGFLTKQNLKGFGADNFDTQTQSLLISISNLFEASVNYNLTDPVSTQLTPGTTPPNPGTTQPDSGVPVVSNNQSQSSATQTTASKITSTSASATHTIAETNTSTSSATQTTSAINTLTSSSATQTTSLINTLIPSSATQTTSSINTLTSSSVTQTTAATNTPASSSSITVNVKLVSTLFNSLDKYFLAAHSYKVPGEAETMGKTKQFDFALKRNFSFDLSNSSIGSLDGGFTFPDYKDILNNSMQSKQILINNVRMKDLVHTWDTNRSQNIFTESQSLSFFSTDGLPIDVKNTSKPINIAIKNIMEKMTGKKMNFSIPFDVKHVKLPLATSCNMLLKFLFLNDPNNLTTLIVYIQYGKIATKLDHDIMLNISGKYGIVMTKNSNPIRNLNVTNTFTDNSLVSLRNQDAQLANDSTLVLWNFNYSTYALLNKSVLHLTFSYSGPMPEKILNENLFTFDKAEYPGTFDYEMKSFCAECNYWNEEANKWMSDGCELDVLSTNFLVTKCKCSHLTTFGGFFLAPTPPPTFSLALFKNGYVLTVAVAIVILMWLLCLPFTRRMDKRDVSKVGICPLFDNCEGENYLYQIVVHTGNLRNAGTKSNIFFKVAGDINESKVRHLKDPARECFQRSSCDVFIMTTHNSLGDLNYIRLWHDNTGGGWYIRNIIITDLQTEKKFLFIGHRWIAVDREDCLLDCVIPAASVEESTNFNYVFKTKAQHKLLDEHLWLSIFTRLPQSNFTRCQRLSVALSLIMTTMMVSTMFYQSLKDQPNVENKMVVFSFNQRQIFVILICSCVNLFLESILINLFCSIRPLQNQKNDSRDLKPGLELNETTITFEEIVKSPLKKTKGKKLLPYWCLFLAWFICVGNIFACGFIVLWYGMSFGNTQSLKWLASITINFAKAIFLFGPIKIFISVVFISLFVKNFDEDRGEVEQQGKMLASNESWLHQPKDNVDVFKKDNLIQPIDSASLKKMRDLRLKSLKMYGIVTELILYIFYALLVFCIGYLARENFAFYQTKNIQELFNLTQRQAPRPEDFSRSYGKIRTSSGFWTWMEKVFIPQIYPEPWYNLSELYRNTDKEDFPGKLFLNDLNSKIVNGIRIRQVRVKPDKCIKNSFMSNLIKVDCLSSYTSSNEETRDFDFSWTIPKQYNSPIKLSTMPWRYQTWQERDGYPYAGSIDNYYGGGYVIEIFPKYKNLAALDQAKKLKWIDRQTRAVIIEFALFNAASSHFSMVTIIVEFPVSGGVVPTFSVFTFNFSLATGIYVWQILFIFMILVLTIRQYRIFIRSGCKCLSEFWNLVECLIILFSIIAVGLFFFKGYNVKVYFLKVII